MPDMQISNDVIEFDEVKCGECKIITVQLHNHKEVSCEWFSSYMSMSKRDERFTPLHLRRAKKKAAALAADALLGGGPGVGGIAGGIDPPKPKTFEIMPPTGTLMPGQRVNIQLKFMPSEEKMYEERVTIRMSQSSQRLMLLCRGKGLEPQVEFSKNSMEFGPILPYSLGDEQEVTLTNPCSFPIEIYNLEFDKTYLEEEKVCTH